MAEEIKNEDIKTEEVKHKTLSNCTTLEFLKQANKIRKAVGDFYKDCDFASIVKRKAEFPEDADDEQKMEIARKFRMDQLNDILDICLETNTEKTVEIIGLMCFMTKEEAINMPANVLLGLALELVSNQAVIDFFSKMVQSGMIDTAST